MNKNISMSDFVGFFPPVFSVSCHNKDRFKFFSFLSLSQQDIIGQMTDRCKLKYLC